MLRVLYTAVSSRHTGCTQAAKCPQEQTVWERDRREPSLNRNLHFQKEPEGGSLTRHKDHHTDSLALLGHGVYVAILLHEGSSVGTEEGGSRYLSILLQHELNFSVTSLNISGLKTA